MKLKKQFSVATYNILVYFFRNGDYIPYGGQDVKETATIKQLPPSTKV